MSALPLLIVALAGLASACASLYVFLKLDARILELEKRTDELEGFEDSVTLGLAKQTADAEKARRARRYADPANPYPRDGNW